MTPEEQAKVMEWQPIETAPKGEDDMILLLCYVHPEDYKTSISIGFWSTIDAFAEDPREGWCDWCEGLLDGEYWNEVKNPTHWMPLPPPPQ